MAGDASALDEGPVPLLRTDGGRGCRADTWGTSDGDGGGPTEVAGACCACVDVDGEAAGAVAGGAPPADLLGTMEGLKRAPPFSIRDDMTERDLQLKDSYRDDILEVSCIAVM